MSLSLPTCTSLLVLALTILPAAVSAAVLPGVPKANLTVYHVNPMSFGGIPFNMDTGYLKLVSFFFGGQEENDGVPTRITIPPASSRGGRGILCAAYADNSVHAIRMVVTSSISGTIQVTCTDRFYFRLDWS